MKKQSLALILTLSTFWVQAQEELDWWNHTVFYEIFVRSFYDSDGDGVGDFKGLTQKLDYLNDGDPETDSDLGITGIWLMPINPSPSYHGYDVTDYRGIHPDYGTMEDFKEFLDEAHARDIKVIIDYVMNHSSTQHPWFLDSRSSVTSDKRDWYVWREENPGFGGPWGQPVWHEWGGHYYYGIFWDGMPDINYNNEAVKSEIFDAAEFWIDDIGIDGFRLDAVKYIYEDGNQIEDLEATHTFFRDFSQHIKSFNPDAMTVGEAWTSTDKVLPYVTNERIDFCFEFDLAASIIGTARNENASGLINRIDEVISTYPYYQFATFLTNHDQNRLMNELGSDEDQVKVAASVYLTIPGVPFIYYGEEIGMLGTKPDENIRRPMQWSSERNAGFTTGTPWNAPSSNYNSNNVNFFEDEPSSILNHYKKLIQARAKYEALRTGDWMPVTASNSAVLSYLRKSGNEKVLVLINPTATNKTFDVDFSAYADPTDLIPYDIISEESMSDNGDLEGIFLRPHQTALIVFDVEQKILRVPANTKTSFYPSPAGNWINFTVNNEAAQQYSIYSLNGQLLQSGSVKERVTVAELPEGMYMMQIKSDGYSVAHQMIIRR